VKAQQQQEINQLKMDYSLQEKVVNAYEKSINDLK